MITEWGYYGRHELTSKVKQIITENKYSAVDVGASIYFWSYPECKAVIDSIPVGGEDTTFIKADLNNLQDLQRIEREILATKQFDFSICSHTLEDIYNPLQLIEFLPKISKRGYIAMPSKFDEFRIHREGFIRGYAHHKTIFDIKDNTVVLFPKYTFIEKDSRSDILASMNGPSDLVFFWEESIPATIFQSGIVSTSDEALITSFYNGLIPDTNGTI